MKKIRLDPDALAFAGQQFHCLALKDCTLDMLGLFTRKPWAPNNPICKRPMISDCKAEGGASDGRKIPFVTFVLGGPGSGKGTQCTRIVETFGFTHLSAGDLLRKEISSNSENGSMILSLIKEGKIVPSEVTVQLIQKAIEARENDRYLIDGFPRSEENRIAYERVIGAEPDIVLFFDCPEEEMVRRVLNRNQGRIDDNIDTVKERLKVFAELNLPVIRHYSKKGKLYKIDGTGSEEEIFERVRPVFAALRPILIVREMCGIILLDGYKILIICSVSLVK
ncbi:ump-cmp kinase [Phtheirospermum japonicum]|uniref:UMP-CMP kinase n=1 Tax=Phtheirospermum japonicum TaxID=374723 RepID=A0A830BN41_9LAMI|nr:ump-cmp kinase [Phtheirospermum japonicum]